MDRRQFLAAVGMSLALAGCSGQTDETTDDDEETESDDGGNIEPVEDTGDSEQNESSGDDAVDESTTETDKNESEPEFDVEMSAPKTVDINEQFDLEITVFNSGDAKGEFESSVSIRREGGSWKTTNTPLSVTVASGDSETVTLEDLSTESGDDIEIRVDEAAVKTSITVEQPATFEYDIDVPETVKAGNWYEITVTVTNVGDRPGETNVLIERDDSIDWETILDVDRDLESGEERKVITEVYAPIENTTQTIRVNEDQEVTVDISPYSESYVTKDPEQPDYDRFSRKLSDYEGDAVHFAFGTVEQLVAGQGDDESDFLLTTVHNGDEEGDIALFWDGEERIIEGDEIKVWGIVEGLYTYETVGETQRTIPEVTLVTFERRRS